MKRGWKYSRITSWEEALEFLKGGIPPVRVYHQGNQGSAVGYAAQETAREVECECEEDDLEAIGKLLQDKIQYGADCIKTWERLRKGFTDENPI